MKEFIFNAHNAAKEKVDLALDLEFLIELLADYLNNNKDRQDIEQKIKEHYGPKAKDYIHYFTNALIHDVLQAGIQKVLERNERLNTEDFSDFLEEQTRKILKKVRVYLNGDISLNELMEFLIRDSFTAVSFEIAKAYGIEKKDIDIIQRALEEGSFNIIAYAISVELYKNFMELMQEAEMIHEERLKIEKHCKELVEIITAYRNHINELVSNYLHGNITSFQAGIRSMDAALLENDSNGFIAANTEILKAMGKKVQFTNQDEFDDLMDSDFDFIL